MTQESKTIEQKIEAWKKKYSKVFRYQTESRESAQARVDNPAQVSEMLTCYLHAPERSVLSAASVVGRNDPMKYNEVLLNNCWIEGDEELRSDTGYFLGISQELDKMIEVKEGELKKL